MKKILLVINLLLAFVFLHGQESATKEHFLKKMDSCDITFLPADSFKLYKEIPIDTSVDVKYDYAIFDSANHFEVRYKILPLGWAAHPHNDSTIKTVMVGQDMIYQSSIMALYYDISQNMGSRVPVQEFPLAAAKNDFNADRAHQMVIKPYPAGFGKGYENIYTMSFYKKDKAMVFIFFLFDSSKTNITQFKRIYMNTYKVLRFND